MAVSIYQLSKHEGELAVYEWGAEPVGSNVDQDIVTCDSLVTARLFAANHDPALPPGPWLPDPENGNNGGHYWYAAAGRDRYFQIAEVEVMTASETEAAGWS